MSNICLVYRLATISYQSARNLQERLAVQIAEQKCQPTLLLLEHPHIFTFGRSGDIKNLLWEAQELEQRGVQIVQADRGGDVTYHGPGQLVGYPLLPLSPGGIYVGIGQSDPMPLMPSIPKADYIGYLRKLEQVLIHALAHFNVTAIRLDGKTGVWLPPEPSTGRDMPAKIAAIGIKLNARGVSQHGFALNINPDMTYWNGIIACGLAGHPAISLSDVLHPLPSRSEVENVVIDSFGRQFGFEMVEGVLDDLPV